MCHNKIQRKKDNSWFYINDNGFFVEDENHISTDWVIRLINLNHMCIKSLYTVGDIFCAPPWINVLMQR